MNKHNLRIVFVPLHYSMERFNENEIEKADPKQITNEWLT